MLSEIATDFHGIQRALIFCIEKPRMGIGHDLSPAIAAHPRAREFDDAVRRYCAARSTASARGSSIAWQRCTPARSFPSTADVNSPWSISTPLRSRCRRRSSPEIACALGTRSNPLSNRRLWISRAMKGGLSA